MTTILTAGPASVDTGPFEPPHTLTGQFHILRQFRSLALQNERDILVYLPPGYDHDPARRYPVLYMHDGQNLFDAVTAFAGQEWHLDETAEALIGAGHIAPLIIVGVGHAGVARAEELTPSRDPRHKAGGSAAAYTRLIVDEVKRYIDEHYRTRPDRDHTGTGGASLGGLISLWLGVTAPETFSRLLVMSPSLWWDRRSLLQRVRAGNEKLPLRIWLDVGTEEGGGTLQNARMLKNALLRRGWTFTDDLRYLEARGHGHNEGAWAARAAAALEFLFPPHDEGR